MDAPKIKVNCDVENCAHNKKQMCHASTLEVSTSVNGEAHSSRSTCCSTFIEE